MSRDGPPVHHGRDDSEPTGGRSRRAAMRARLAIAKREIASLRSEKTIVLALLIQLFVASFSSFLVVGLVSLYDPGSVEGYTLQMAVGGNASDEVIEVVGNDDSIEVVQYESAAEAREGFQNRRVDAMLVATHAGNGTVAVQATVPDENLRTTVIIVQVRETLQAMEENLRQEYRTSLDREVLDVPPKQGSSPYFGFTYTVLVPLLMFLPVFISGSIAVDSLTEESQRGTLELLRVAPVTLGDIVDAKLLATATLAPVQAALWLGLLWFNGTGISNPLVLVGLVGALAVLVVSVGIGIALAAADRRQAQFLYSTGVLGAITVAGLLPEHPANTVARLAIGSPGEWTWAFVVVYACLGVLAYLGTRLGVQFMDPEGL
ncbi:ABC transporter permease [Haloarchaeobius litoreus]|uniref:ABC transporter permease n=1 Tax=Haloarchaeobius litoreus TaxID=755306 RepID=A0ABD6DHM3_9EURY|nr:ABC transporter permease [Haloarchaeobius litoreus]